jgi:hypothetical protein
MATGTGAAGAMAKKKKSQASKAQQQADAARRRGGGVPLGRGGASAVPTADEPARGTSVAGLERQGAQVGHAAQPATAQAYLDVSAVRIQEWLARTPDLKFRRGASVLLTEATGREAWEEHGVLPAGVGWNDEAGDVDGVVSLVMDERASDAGLIEEAARLVAGRLRAKMPYCLIQAVAGTGSSYVEAYKGMAEARREGRYLVDSPAAQPEVVVAKPCDQCRSAAATEPGGWKTDAGPRDLCGDCDARLNAAGRTGGSRRMEPRPERRLREALEKAGMTVIGFPDNIQELADAGRVDADDTPSQVALVYADGNGVGTFLSAAASSRVPKQEIVPLIEEATLGALADAVRGRYAGWARPPVLANLAGGDDLLVSVPAADAWQFTRVLVKAFGERIAEAASGWPKEIRERCPSLSAGIVFHHVKDPFSDLVRLAGEQLKAAKSETRGRSASIAFLDLTAEGVTPPEGRHPLPLFVLDRMAGKLARIEREIPPSRRARLLELLRQDRTEQFIGRLTDFANDPLWELATGRAASPEAVRDELRDNPEAVDELRRSLDIARHWHADARPEPAAGGRKT